MISLSWLVSLIFGEANLKLSWSWLFFNSNKMSLPAFETRLSSKGLESDVVNGEELVELKAVLL